MGVKINTVTMTKLGILAAIIASVILAFVLPGSFIARATAIFFGVCAASFLPAYTAAIYWKRTTRKGVWASMISGALISMFCLAFLHRSESASLGICQAVFGRTELISNGVWPFVDSIVYSLPLSAIILIVVSLITRPETPEHFKQCFDTIKK